MRPAITAMICLSLLAGCIGPMRTTLLPVDFRTVRAGVVTVAVPGSRYGSGFVVGSDETSYYVGTAAHVVGTATTVWIDARPGRVVQTDPEADVALLAVPRAGRHYLVLLQGVANVGDRCRVLGFHRVNALQPEFMVLKGHVSTVNFRGKIGANTGMFPGNSGGPLVNDAGLVVGISTGMPIVAGAPHESMSLFARPGRLYAMLQNHVKKD